MTLSLSYCAIIAVGRMVDHDCKMSGFNCCILTLLVTATLTPLTVSVGEVINIL